MPLLESALDRRIVALALPALGALAVEPLYVLVDTAIVGRLGTTPLAGLALASSVLLLVVAGCNFLAYGTTQRLAHQLGAGRPEAAAGVGVQALWLAAFLGVPLAVLVALLAQPAAWLLGGRGEVLDAAVVYLRISAIGLPFVLIALVGNGVLRGVADLRKPLVIVVVANVANLVLEVVAVYGLDLGIAGSAASTVVVQAGAALAFLVAMRPHLLAAGSRRPQRDELLPLLSAGRHLLLRVGGIIFVFTASTAVAARVDDVTLAAQQIVVQAFNLFALTIDALAIPAQTLVAQAIGSSAGEASGIEPAMAVGRRVLRLSVIAGIGLGVVLALLAWPLPNVFTHDPAVASRATAGLLVLAVSQLPAGIAMGLDGVLIGGGDYRFLGRASVAYLAAFAPFAVATLVWPALGIVGVWLAVACWLVARAITNQVRFERRRWAHAV